MNEDSIKLLGLRRLPARLNAEQAAVVLGFQQYDIPVLVKAKCLKVLGNPPQQAVKQFAATEIEKCAADPDWLNRATKVIYQYWMNQNGRRKKALTSDSNL